MLPVLFIVLASGALAVALGALFASLRASLAGPTEEGFFASAGPDRGALEDEKNALLRALKDLEYEHEVGKIDDDDYAKLERAYRARAKEVLGELDRDLRPYLSRAESLASGVEVGEGKKGKKKQKKKDAAEAKAVENPRGGANDGKTARIGESESADEGADGSAGADEGADGDGSAAGEGSAPETVTRIAAPLCPKCGTVNDADAAFCKRCATPLTNAEASS